MDTPILVKSPAYAELTVSKVNGNPYHHPIPPWVIPRESWNGERKSQWMGCEPDGAGDT